MTTIPPANNTGHEPGTFVRPAPAVTIDRADLAPLILPAEDWTHAASWTATNPEERDRLRALHIRAVATGRRLPDPFDDDIAARPVWMPNHELCPLRVAWGVRAETRTGWIFAMDTMGEAWAFLPDAFLYYAPEDDPATDPDLFTPRELPELPEEGDTMRADDLAIFGGVQPPTGLAAILKGLGPEAEALALLFPDTATAADLARLLVNAEGFSPGTIEKVRAALLMMGPAVSRGVRGRDGGHG